jgi:hypothetical protein
VLVVPVDLVTVGTQAQRLPAVRFSLALAAGRSRHCAPLPLQLLQIPFEQKEPDYLLWGPLRSRFASSSTPAGCLLRLIHGLDEGARGAKSQRKK